MRGLDGWITHRTTPLIAALVVLFAALPGLLALPVLDRDEARFAQGTAQMLDDGDFTAIRFQQSLRGGSAPGAHWLQAIVVKAVSTVEARAIQPYRLPSLLGLMLAAGACAWGAAGLFGRRAGGLAGVLFASTFGAAAAGGIAGSQGLFMGACALALAAFGRIYAASRGEPDAPKAGRRTKVLLWTGVILGVLFKGPLMLGLAILTGAVLFAFDRRAPWFRGLGWGWGLIALFAIAGPWTWAVTVATDGEFWSPGATIAGAGAPLGVQTLAAPLLLFPLSALLPLAAVFAWRSRTLAGVRLAVAFAAPAWLAFELAPDKQAHDALPLYVALVWLAAAAATLPWTPGAAVRRVAAGLSLVCGLILGVGAVVLAIRFGAGGDVAMAALVAALLIAAALASAVAALRSEPAPPLLLACALAVLAHGAMLGVLLPQLERLWPSREALSALTRSGLDPRGGIALGPVATAGYAEPSLVFALGAATETGDARAAAAAIDEGRPAIVEAAEEAAFRREASRLGARPRAAATLEGFDYPRGADVKLTLYAPPKARR